MASDTINKTLRLKDEASGALGKVEGAAGKAAKGLKGAGQSTDTAAKAARRSIGSWTELSSKMNVIAQAARTVGKGLLSMTQGLADSRNELADTATRTGLTIKTLAGLRLAAEGSGQQLGSLAGSLQQFPKRMADVARDTGEAKDAMKQLGIAVTDSSGHLRSADVVMKEVIAKLNEYGPGTEQAALATQVFGRSGGALMQALSGAELEDFTKLAEEYGVSLAPKAIEESARWQRAVANLGLAFDGLKDKVGASVTGPGGAAGLLEDMTVGFVFLGSIAEQVVDRIKRAFDGLGEVLAGPFAAVALALEGDYAAALRALKGIDVQGFLGSLNLSLGDQLGMLQQATDLSLIHI